MRRRLILTLLPAMGLPAMGLATLIGARPALAAMEAPFTQAAFTTAQKAGKPILVDITAPWCPTCAAQKPILGMLAIDPAFKDLVIFHVDFDSQKDVVRTLNARSQSTLIVFRGMDERGRSAGDTNAASITELVRKGVN